MFKVYCKVMFFAGTITQLSEVMIASDHQSELSQAVTIPRLDLLDLRPSIHYSHVMYDVNKRESDADAEKFRLLAGALITGVRRNNWMIDESKKQNKLSILTPSNSLDRIEELDSQNSLSDSVCNSSDDTEPFSQFSQTDQLSMNLTNMNLNFCPGVRPKVSKNRFFSELSGELSNTNNCSSSCELDRDYVSGKKTKVDQVVCDSKEQELKSSTVVITSLEEDDFSVFNLSVFSAILGEDDQLSSNISGSMFNVSPLSTESDEGKSV